MRKDPREIVKRHLTAMVGELNEVEQTTHSSLWKDGMIQGVAEALAHMMNTPTAYHVGEFVQRTVCFLERDL